MPAPRSDYECSRCAKTYELPIGTTACPDCKKSRWFTRVYAANVSTSGISKRKDPQLEAAHAAAMAPKEAAKLSAQQLRAPMLAVPIGQVAQAVNHHAKSQLQAAGMPESRMGVLPVPALKQGTSSYKDGTVRPSAPIDQALTKEMKLKPPRPRVAARDKGAGEHIAKALQK